MSSATRIGNLALAHLGTGKQIANLEQDQSQEGVALRLFYHIARQELLRDYRWPFATRIEALALLLEDPNEEWSYSYRYPANCLDLRKIQSGQRLDARATKVKLRVGQDAAGLVIFTDQDSAIAEYTVDEENVAKFHPDFFMALSFRLAAYVAPQVTKGDPLGMQSKMFDRAILWSRNASANAMNEESPDEALDSEFIRAR
jgi:hypothetical protein